MRVDLAHVRERDLRRADEAVVDRQNRLGHDRERRLVEQVVRLGDRPDERALDREDAVRHASRGDRVDDVRERGSGDQAGRREEPVAGSCRMSAFAAGVGDGEFDGSHERRSAFRWSRVAGRIQLDGARQVEGAG